MGTRRSSVLRAQPPLVSALRHQPIRCPRWAGCVHLSWGAAWGPRCRGSGTCWMRGHPGQVLGAAGRGQRAQIPAGEDAGKGWPGDQGPGPSLRQPARRPCSLPDANAGIVFTHGPQTLHLSIRLLLFTETSLGSRACRGSPSGQTRCPRTRPFLAQPPAPSDAHSL